MWARERQPAKCLSGDLVLMGVDRESGRGGSRDVCQVFFVDAATGRMVARMTRNEKARRVAPGFGVVGGMDWASEATPI